MDRVALSEACTLLSQRQACCHTNTCQAPAPRSPSPESTQELACARAGCPHASKRVILALCTVQPVHLAMEHPQSAAPPRAMLRGIVPG